MKKILKTSANIICLLLITILSSCEKNLYEDGIIKNTSQQNQRFTISYLEESEARKFKSIVEDKIDRYSAANRGGEIINYGTVKYDQVLKTIDNLGNKTYMFRVEHPDASYEKFFNMILQKKVDGSSLIKLFEYTMTPEFAEKFYNGEKKMKDFQGSYSYRLLASELHDTRDYDNGDYGGGGGGSSNTNDGNTGTPTNSGNNPSGVGSLEPGSGCPPCPQGNGSLNGNNSNTNTNQGDSGSNSDGGGYGSSPCFILAISLQKVWTSNTCWYDINYIDVDCGPQNRGINDASPCPPCNSGNNGVAIFEPTNALSIFNTQLNSLTGSTNTYNTFNSLNPETKAIINNYISQSAINVSHASTFFANLNNNNQLSWFSYQQPATQISIINYCISENFSPESQSYISNVITQITQNSNSNFDTIWYNKSLLDNATGDIDNNTSGNYDKNTYAEFNLQQAPWPTIESVIPVQQFIGWGYPGVKRNCMDYAKAQIATLGYQISNYSATGQTFQIYREQTGVNQIKLAQGVSYLAYALWNGIPVIVGIDDKVGVPLNHDGTPANTDLTTDHFIVIVGMGSNSNGNYFQFYDNASGNPTQGANSLNLLYYNASTGIISGQSQTSYSQGSNMHDYIITQIRKSK